MKLKLFEIMQTKGLVIGFVSMFESAEKVIVSYVLSQKIEDDKYQPEVLKAAKGEKNLKD